MTVSGGPAIWIEVDDYLRYFDGSLTPTGIGRVQSEIIASLALRHADRVRFCRIGTDERQIEILSQAEVERLADGNAFLARHRRDNPLFPLFALQRYVARRLAAAGRGLTSKARTQAFVEAVRPGDILMNLGASWTHRNFGRTVAALKARFGMRFALLVHDVLPVSHPDYVNPRHSPTFKRWLGDMAAVWDVVMTPSNSSAQALSAHLARAGHEVPAITVLPFGAGFDIAETVPEAMSKPQRGHVLYVSTIEIRKNHMLLCKVWDSLIRKHGAAAMPELVFAGKYGWDINELRQMLKKTSFLGGKIKVVENLSDAALAALYRASLFTVFPSFCEGWGLPVAESLYYGRPCIASDATSIPEVGGRFVQYHDPRDVDAATRLIEAAIFDGETLAARERLIHAEYRPPSWDETADAIVAAVDASAPAVPASRLPRQQATQG